MLHPGGRARVRAPARPLRHWVPRAWTSQPPLPIFQAQRVGPLRRRRRREDFRGRGARPGGVSPGDAWIPGRSSDPHPASSPWAAAAERARGQAAVRPPGPRALTRSLPALLRSLPRRGRPAPAAAAPFVSRTGLSRSHGPPPPPRLPPHRGKTRPAPSPQTRTAPDPGVPASAPAPRPRASTQLPAARARTLALRAPSAPDRALLAPLPRARGLPAPGLRPALAPPVRGPSFPPPPSAPAPGPSPFPTGRQLPFSAAELQRETGRERRARGVSQDPARGPHLSLCAAPSPDPRPRCFAPSRPRATSQGLRGP